MREHLRKLWPLVKLLLGLAIVVIIGRRFYLDLRDHPGLWEYPLRPAWLVLSGALYILGWGFSALCWHRLLVSVGQRPRFVVALRAYFIGHMGKYLPGKAWALFVRSGLVRGPHVSAGLAAVTAFYEVFVTMSAAVLTAAVLFMLLLPPGNVPLGSGRVRHQMGAMLQEITKGGAAPIDWQRLRAEVTNPEAPGAPLDRTLALALSVGLLVPLLALILPPVFNRMAHRATLPFRDRNTRLPPLGWRALAEGLVATGLNWFCQGASVWAVLQGVLPRPPDWTGDAWGLLTAVMGVSYVAGFVVLLAPSGLGVREFFLTVFLVAILGSSSPEEEASVLLAVLVLRLVATAAEVMTVALVWKLPGPPVLLRKGAAP